MAVVTGSAAGTAGEAAVPAGHGAGSASTWCGASDKAVQAMAAAAGGKFATGFASSKSKVAADALWQRLRQDGPPFFKKIRSRSSLDDLEDPAAGADRVSSAAEDLWRELCGQTWRVELDYGLEGADAAPRDDLLLVCTGLAVTRFLAHAGLEPDEVAWASGYALVDVPGYDSSNNPEPLRSWRQLKPRLLATRGSGAAVPA